MTIEGNLALAGATRSWQWDMGMVRAQLSSDPIDRAGTAFVFSLADGGSSESYGEGWPGALGVLEIELDRKPLVCTTVQLDVSNSRGVLTVGVLLIGAEEVDWPTSLGGTLLVNPIAFVTLALPGQGLALPIAIPCDPALGGAVAFLQALEVDPGASRGVSFTQGLCVQIGKCP